MVYLKKGGHYKFIIETNNTILTFVGVVKEFDSMFVVFIDDIYSRKYTFNLNKVVSIEEVQKVKDDRDTTTT